MTQERASRSQRTWTFCLGRDFPFPNHLTFGPVAWEIQVNRQSRITFEQLEIDENFQRPTNKNRGRALGRLTSELRLHKSTAWRRFQLSFRWHFSYISHPLRLFSITKTVQEKFRALYATWQTKCDATNRYRDTGFIKVSHWRFLFISLRLRVSRDFRSAKADQKQFWPQGGVAD